MLGFILQMIAGSFTVAGMYIGSTTRRGAWLFMASTVPWWVVTIHDGLWGFVPLNIVIGATAAVNLWKCHTSAPDERKPFETDGCSGGMSFLWDWFAGKPPPWEDCCEAHDRAYWKGGTAFQRLCADVVLWHCVAARGWPKIAKLMYALVRIGGHPYWPTSYRWDYGRRWPGRYKQMPEIRGGEEW